MTAIYSSILSEGTLFLKEYDIKLQPGDPEGTVVLPHHKLADVVNQKALIDKMRHGKTGEFVYLHYAVPRSSEHYTPYALT